MTDPERLHLLVDQLSDGETSETLAYLEQRRTGGGAGAGVLSANDLLTALQEAVLSRVPPDVSLVDELLAERRGEVG